MQVLAHRKLGADQGVALGMSIAGGGAGDVLLEDQSLEQGYQVVPELLEARI